MTALQSPKEKRKRLIEQTTGWLVSKEINMSRTLEMFDKPRKPRQWLMHVSNGGGDGPDDVWVQFQCQRCGLETGWMKARTVTEAKRGIPCPACNEGTK